MLLLLSLFAYTTHTLYIDVSSEHVIICTHSDRKYKQLWDIMYHIPAYTFELYTYVSSSRVKRSVPSFFGLPSFYVGLPSICHFCWLALLLPFLLLIACPPFAIFVGLPFSRFYRACLPRFPSSYFNCVFFQNKYYVALGPGSHEPSSTIKYCTKYPTLPNSKEFVPQTDRAFQVGEKKLLPCPECKVRSCIDVRIKNIIILLFPA